MMLPPSHSCLAHEAILPFPLTVISGVLLLPDCRGWRGPVRVATAVLARSRTDDTDFMLSSLNLRNYPVGNE